MKSKLVKGFTLIELLVVIAIIGILASVVLTSLNSAREKSRDATRVAQLKEMAKAFELYYADNGTYPPEGGSPCTTCWGGLTDDLVTGGYLGAIPLDPTNGNTANGYRFRTNGPGQQSYTLMARLESDSHSGWCKLVGGNGDDSWATESAYVPISDAACQ